MPRHAEYDARERLWLWMMAIVGGLGVNGAFLYGLFFDRGALVASLENPVAVAFQIEALLLLGALTYLLPRWGVTRIRRRWFVVLAILGSLAFALPVALLRRGNRGDGLE